MRDLAPIRQYCLTLGSDGGAWSIPSVIDQRNLQVIASWGGGWDHISVSRANRVPNWAEMEQIARLFFADDEAAMQLHVPRNDHINTHPNCLHWWRPQKLGIPLPPKVFV